MTSENNVKSEWRASAPLGNEPPTLEELRNKALKMRRATGRRNQYEYIAGSVCLLWFSYLAATSNSPFYQAACILLVLGTLVAMTQLSRRTAAVAADTDTHTASLVSSYRDQLMRERDALSSVFYWYLCPVIPGLAAFQIAPLLEGGLAQAARPEWFLGTGLGGLLLLYIWLANRKAANRLQALLDDFNRSVG